MDREVAHPRTAVPSARGERSGGTGKGEGAEMRHPSGREGTLESSHIFYALLARVSLRLHARGPSRGRRGRRSEGVSRLAVGARNRYWYEMLLDRHHRSHDESPRARPTVEGKP